MHAQIHCYFFCKHLVPKHLEPKFQVTSPAFRICKMHLYCNSDSNMDLQTLPSSHSDIHFHRIRVRKPAYLARVRSQQPLQSSWLVPAWNKLVRNYLKNSNDFWLRASIELEYSFDMLELSFHLIWSIDMETLTLVNFCLTDWNISWYTIYYVTYNSFYEFEIWDAYFAMSTSCKIDCNYDATLITALLAIYNVACLIEQCCKFTSPSINHFYRKSTSLFRILNTEKIKT